MRGRRKIVRMMSREVDKKRSSFLVFNEIKENTINKARSEERL